jgi:hypothetical protein
MTATAQLSDPAAIREFVLAGNATFTVVSRKTGERRTFRAALAPNPKLDGPWFVSMLTGPDNENHYRYLGVVWSGTAGMRFTPHGKPGMEGAKEIVGWVFRALEAGTLTEQAEFWHEGRCGRCGRLLTDPESIARGLGPICIEKESAIAA